MAFSPVHDFHMVSPHDTVSPLCEESFFLDDSTKFHESWQSGYQSPSYSSDDTHSVSDGLVPSSVSSSLSSSNDFEHMLSSNQPSYQSPITGSPHTILGNSVNANRWQEKNPDTWDHLDVSMWLQWASEHLRLPNLRPDAFSGIDGPILGKMHMEDFQQREPSYGTELYLAFNQFKSSYYSQHQPNLPEFHTTEHLTSIEKYINNISFDKDDTFPSLPPFDSFRAKPFFTPKQTPTALKEEPEKDEELSDSAPASPAESDASSGNSPPRGSRRGRSKGKLWEFVLNLLLDTKTNPNIIKWEDRSNGVFRIVRSDQVAKLWGIRKSNPTMTYEKMSRAMRYTRAMGFLAELPNGHNYPRQLTFKMGRNATGWRSD